jgi:cation diffusion facilitator family transporter
MSGSDEHSTKYIVQSLLVNMIIAVVKTAAAVFTRSGSMLAEALHSFSDCGNQLLLLVGVRQARRLPDASHPFGYGRALYFWSFIVALLLFTGGGVFSIYEGIHKLREPEPVQHVWVGLAILFVSVILEGGATLSNIKDLNKRRTSKSDGQAVLPFFRYLSATKDSDLVVIFAENSAAVLGLLVAMLALALAALTGDGRYDGAGSIGIGLVLVGVAAFLAVEVKSLLIGEAADPAIDASVHRACDATPGVVEIIHLRSVQQGPGEVLVAVKATFDAHLSVQQVAETIDLFEANIRKEHPEVRWLFVEPDVKRASSS